MYDYPRITKHIEPYSEENARNKRYGMFGYMGLSVEAAIKNQDVDGIQKAFELGWIDPKTPRHMQTLGFPSLVAYVESRKLPVALEKLKSLGFD